MGRDFFDALVDTLFEYKNTVDYYNGKKAYSEKENEHIDKLKYAFQDALDDYIDHRIEKSKQ